MKKTVISLLLATAVICSISVNVFATDNTCPHVMVKNTEVVSLK